MAKTAWIIIVASLAGLLIPASVFAQISTLQAETFTDSHDIAYAVIQSAGSILLGLDYPGEWTEYQLGLSKFGEYSVHLTIKGDDRVPYELSLTLADISGNAQTCDFTFVGVGTG